MKHIDSENIYFGDTTFFRELSPFYNSSNIVVGHIRYCSLVHYWLASRYSDLNDSIYSFKTPESILNYCKKRYGFVDFGEVDNKNIISGVRYNLAQNMNIRDMLYSTYGFHLIFNGKGYLAENNRYGRLLEYIRDTYDRDSFK